MDEVAFEENNEFEIPFILLYSLREDMLNYVKKGEKKAASHQISQLIHGKVSVADSNWLYVVLSNEELFEALTSMKNGMSPNIDKLSCEFFKAM